MHLDEDDLPGYLHDAYVSALAHNLLQLNLTRVGGEGRRMWQCSSRFPGSSGYHVEIEADPLEAVMKALGAWARVEGAVQADARAVPVVQEEPVGGLFD